MNMLVHLTLGLIVCHDFQVYTAQRVEYVGGNFFGNENGESTRTLLSFLVSSLRGSYEDLICYVPITTLNWSTLLEHFNTVLKALFTVGLSVVLVLVDGHRTNIRFFSELGEGHCEITIQHPFDPESKLFTLYDPVHIFKNFYHNFHTHRYQKIVAVHEAIVIKKLLI
jgi:hypothetical protein